MSPVLLFVDNSNIFISAKDEAFRREGRAAKDQVRLQFDVLLELALAGRRLAHAFVVGSIPPEQRVVWERLQAATGVKALKSKAAAKAKGKAKYEKRMVRTMSVFKSFPPREAAFSEAFPPGG